MLTDHLTSWLEIDLGAIASNTRQMRAIAGVPVLAVVKANGYGHGLVEAARAALAGGAAWCGVARLEEALALRQAGITAPLLVLGYIAPPRAAEAAQAGVSAAAANYETARAYAEALRSAKQTLRVHAKIDTGLGRLGVSPAEGVAFVRFLASQPEFVVEGVFTHFASADDPAKPTTLEQIAHFQEVLAGLSAAGLRPPLVHAANSAAALYFPQARYDMVRSGIALYGLHPAAEAPLPPSFRPALTWKARLSSVKVLPPGHGISYNHRYRTSAAERIGAVAIGYADGFRRRLGNFALVGGKRVNVVGGVCMDQCMVQLDGVPEAQVGDEVVLLGRQGSQAITAEEIGKAWGGNNYEVVCGLAARLPRLYTNGGEEIDWKIW